jgi:D-alanine transaminase
LGNLAYINGEFCDLDQALVSVEDRGFQFADAIYEGLTTYGGRPFRLREHLRRLRDSARAVELKLTLSDEQIERIVTEGIRRCGHGEVHIYMQVTRGVASRAHPFPANAEPTVVLTFKPKIRASARDRRNGVKVITQPDNRWGSCHVKTVMLLPNVLAKEAALRRGAYDTIFLGPDRVVYEATSSNVFVVRDGGAWTPRRREKILPGITRDYILENLGALDLDGGEKVLHLADLYEADEVFLTGTTTEVLGVVAVDERPVGAGRVGPITELIYERLFAALGTA